MFFWNEEHAREARQREGGVRGTYLTLEQAAHVTRETQSALFGFAVTV